MQHLVENYEIEEVLDTTKHVAGIYSSATREVFLYEQIQEESM